jgi:hypothetical protein
MEVVMTKFVMINGADSVKDVLSDCNIMSLPSATFKSTAMLFTKDLKFDCELIRFVAPYHLTKLYSDIEIFITYNFIEAVKYCLNEVKNGIFSIYGMKHHITKSRSYLQVNAVVVSFQNHGRLYRPTLLLHNLYRRCTK